MTDELATTTPLLWTNSKASAGQPTLVRLTPTALTLANVVAADLEPVIDAMREGAEVAAQVIPLACIEGAKGDESDAEVTVTFLTGPTGRESKTIPFAERSARDEFVAALATALGPGWHNRRVPVPRWKILLWILLPTALAALATWGLHAEAARIAAGRPPINWGKNGKLKLLAHVAHWAERQLGPNGILIAGGVLVAAGLLLFAIAMAYTPKTWVVAPDEATAAPEDRVS